jgi:hypothetical protein
LLRERIREIKLFYILTGYETETDLAEFREFARWLKERRRATNSGIRVLFSAGLLVRMPGTPLQFDRLFLGEADFKSILGPVKSACETNGFEFRLAAGWADYAATQVFALGGEWSVELMRDLAADGLCCDTALPLPAWERIKAWLQERGHWSQTFLGEKTGDNSAIYQQYEQNKTGADIGYCLGVKGPCAPCDACQTPAQRRAIRQHRLQPPNDLPAFQALMARKARLKPVYVRLQIPREWRGATTESLNARMFARLLQQSPGLIDNLLSVREAIFTSRGFSVTGETVFALKAWDPSALGLELLADFSPEMFRQATIEIGRIGIGEQLQDWLHAEHIPFTTQRDSEGYHLRIPPVAHKKKIVFDVHVKVDVARLNIGPKCRFAVGQMFVVALEL